MFVFYFAFYCILMIQVWKYAHNEVTSLGAVGGGGQRRSVILSF